MSWNIITASFITLGEDASLDLTTRSPQYKLLVDTSSTGDTGTYNLMLYAKTIDGHYGSVSFTVIITDLVTSVAMTSTDIYYITDTVQTLTHEPPTVPPTLGAGTWSYTYT